MRPNTMKAHGKEGMFRQLPLMTPFSSGGFTSQNADRWLISVFAAAAVFSILIFLMSLSIFFEETGSLWMQGFLVSHTALNSAPWCLVAFSASSSDIDYARS